MFRKIGQNGEPGHSKGGWTRWDRPQYIAIMNDCFFWGNYSALFFRSRLRESQPRPRDSFGAHSGQSLRPMTTSRRRTAMYRGCRVKYRTIEINLDSGFRGLVRPWVCLERDVAQRGCGRSKQAAGRLPLWDGPRRLSRLASVVRALRSMACCPGVAMS